MLDAEARRYTGVTDQDLGALALSLGDEFLCKPQVAVKVVEKRQCVFRALEGIRRPFFRSAHDLLYLCCTFRHGGVKRW